MKNSTIFCVVDTDGSDRLLPTGEDNKISAAFDSRETLLDAVDRYQQSDKSMDAMPWTAIQRTQTVLGTFRKQVPIDFKPETGFVEAE